MQYETFSNGKGRNKNIYSYSLDKEPLDIDTKTNKRDYLQEAGQGRKEVELR